MADKIKVINHSKHDYGVITTNNIHMNIRPGSFAMLTEDDIAFIQSITTPGKKPFSNGKLIAEKAGSKNILEEIGIEKEEINYLEDDAQIDKRLKGSLASVKKWLDEITDNTLLYNIAVRAKALDLPSSKMRAIEEKAPGTRLFD